MPAVVQKKCELILIERGLGGRTLARVLTLLTDAAHPDLMGAELSDGERKKPQVNLKSGAPQYKVARLTNDVTSAISTMRSWR